jgi:hypothetical protein
LKVTGDRLQVTENAKAGPSLFTQASKDRLPGTPALRLKDGYVLDEGRAFALSHPWRKKRAMDGAPGFCGAAGKKQRQEQPQILRLVSRGTRETSLRMTTFIVVAE